MINDIDKSFKDLSGGQEQSDGGYTVVNHFDKFFMGGHSTRKSNRNQNEEYIVEDFMKRYGITDEEMQDLTPDELKQKVRGHKLDNIL